MSEEKPIVKLLGENGNAFSILAKCEKAWRKAGNDEASWKVIETQMTSGDYDNLLAVAQRFFEVV